MNLGEILNGGVWFVIASVDPCQSGIREEHIDRRDANQLAEQEITNRHRDESQNIPGQSVTRSYLCYTAMERRFQAFNGESTPYNSG